MGLLWVQRLTNKIEEHNSRRYCWELVTGRNPSMIIKSLPKYGFSWVPTRVSWVKYRTNNPCFLLNSNNYHPF